jgi:hypothetical protein
MAVYWIVAPRSLLEKKQKTAMIIHAAVRTFNFTNVYTSFADMEEEVVGEV